MLEIIVLFIIGLVSSTFGSIVGLGGGVIIVPALVYLGPHLLGQEIGTPLAVGTSLAVLIITALASTLVYTKQKKVDYASGWLFFAASGPAAMVGSALTGLMKQGTFQLVFGIFMLVMAGLMVARDYLKPLHMEWKIKRTFTDASGIESTYGYNRLPALAIGVGVGLVSGLFGIGGGSLFVPAMVLLFRFPPHIAAATSMFVIFLSSILGSGVHALQGEIDWLLVLILAPGAWIGGRLGAWIASKLSGPSLLWLLRITLFALAVKLIIDGLGHH